MSALAFRCRVSVPPSTDATETTILTPPATAADGTARPHSDALQIATIPGVGGYQPYMGMPTIRHARLDIVSKRTQIGSATIPVVDVRTGTGNAARWMSAFLGDSIGRSAILGCKAVIEESTNGGASWTAVFTGRVTSRSLDDVLTYGLTLSEATERTKQQIFVGRPIGAAYASAGLVWPRGLPISYGTMGATLPGRVTSVTGANPWTVVLADDGADVNVVTEGFASVLSSVATPFTTQTGVTTYYLWNYNAPVGSPAKAWWMRARYDTGEEYGVVQLQIGRRANGRLYLVSAVLDRLPVGTLGYSASTPPSNRGFRLYTTPWTAPTATTPILITDVHPVQLWMDILDGKFSLPSDDGTINAARKIAYDASAFTTALTWPMANARALVTEPQVMADWIETNILQPFTLAYYLDGSGRVVPQNVRRPATWGGVPALTDATVIGAPSWSESSAGAFERIDVVAQQDTPTVDATATAAAQTDQTGKGSAYALASQSVPLLSDIDVRALDVGAQVAKWSPQTFRVTGGATGAATMSELSVVTTAARQAVEELRHLAGLGVRTIGVQTTRAIDVRAGQFVTLQTSPQPDPNSNRRGNTLLCLVVGRDDTGPVRQYALVDAGPITACTTPTIATLTSASPTITATVTRNAASDDVEVWYAVTTTAVGSPPATDDPRWRLWGVVSATGTANVAPLTPNGRVWVRARSVASRAAVVTRRQPSVFVAPAPAYLDPTPIGALGSLTVTQDGSTGTYDLAWTNTNSTVPVRVVVTPTGGAAVVAATLVPGTTGVRLYHQSDPRASNATALWANSTTYGLVVELVHQDWGAGRISVTGSLTTGVAVPPSAPVLTATVSDGSPTADLTKSAITYVSPASGGVLAVTKNGTVVSPGASPWTVTRPTDPGKPDVYLFTWTPTSSPASALTAQVTVLSNFLFAASGGGTPLTKSRYTIGGAWYVPPASLIGGGTSKAIVNVNAPGGTGAVTCWIGVDAPGGAKIATWAGYVSRANANCTVSLRLYRIDAASGGVTAIGAASNASALAGVRDLLGVSGLSETVAAYAYAIEAVITPHPTLADTVFLEGPGVGYAIADLAAGFA